MSSWKKRKRRVVRPSVPSLPEQVLSGDNPNHKFKGDAQELRAIFPPMDATHKCSQSFWSSPLALGRSVRTKPEDAWYDCAWDKGEGFRGTKSMDEAVKIVEQGWRDGAKQASKLLDRIRATHPLMKKPIKYGIAGTHPNVPRAIAGAVMNMFLPDNKKASRRTVITLLSDMSANCSHHKDELINRAAVVAALIDQIEASGYACDVICYSYTMSGSTEALTAVLVKNSNQPVDIARLAFGVGHPSMLRRFAFADWCAEPLVRGLGSGLGHVRNLDRSKLTGKNIFDIAGVEGTSCFETEEKAEKEGLDYIVKDLQKQGFAVFSDVKIEDDGATKKEKSTAIDDMLKRIMLR